MEAYNKKIININKDPLTNQLNGSNSSSLKKYQSKVLGNEQFTTLIKYELTTLLSGNLPGALGYLFRKILYPYLFKNVGSGAIFGKGIVLRHPQHITLKNRVAIDDYVLLDASGAGEEGITLEEDIIISRNCVIQGKTGSVWIGKKTNIGCHTIITSGAGIFIGHSVLIGGNCYIGGGRYISDRIDIPMMEQGLYSKGPVMIGDDVWLGAGATILDGVEIGKGAIVGAGAVVTKNIPDYAIAVGVPARVIQIRQDAKVQSNPNSTS